MMAVNQKDWPPDVEPITVENTLRLGVGRSDNKLYWDGRPVITERRLVLTFWQHVIAAVAFFAGIGEIVQGIDAGHNFACKIGWAQSCPKD
jgi:hypothetical protein